MEKTQHLFENGIYLISNQAVAKHTLFINEEIQKFFIERMEHHLDPVCKIIGYSLNNDEFQILVRLKKRENFESHFLSKKRNRALCLSQIPDSTYIFSQCMANFQVSFVKYYNYKTERRGALMAGRFERKLVE